MKYHPTAKQPALASTGKGASRTFQKNHSWARGISSISTESLYVQATAFNNAFKGANRDGFVAMHGHDHLSAIFVTPFLVAARLGNHRKTMLAQNFDDIPCAANWIPAAHGTASSIIFAPLGSLTGAGSNQSASASLALVMASASVSPAVAQPGISGNTADQRLASGSNSTNNRNFIIKMITLVLHRSKLTDKICTDGSGGLSKHQAANQEGP